MLSDATEHVLHKQLGHCFSEGQDSNSLAESGWLLCGALFKQDSRLDIGTNWSMQLRLAP